jgi:lipopolysaccharide transport system ATP-binding protein
VLFASHSLQQVIDQCDRAIWLQAGRVRVDAPVEEVVERYSSAMHDETLALTPRAPDVEDGALRLGTNRLGSQEVTIDRVRIAPPAGLGDEIRTGGPLEVQLDVTARRRVEQPHVVVTIRRPTDELVVANLSTEAAGVTITALDGAAAVALQIEALELAPGAYIADVGVFEHAWSHAYDMHLGAYAFEVNGAGTHLGVVLPRHTWTVTSA